MRQVPWLKIVRMNPASREQNQELFVRRTRSGQAQTGAQGAFHLILVTLLLVLVPHGMLHRETVCLLLFKDKIIHFEATELSPQKVHSQEPVSPVDLSVTSGRTVRTSLGSSLPPAQFESEGTGSAKSELDLKDEYIISSFDNELNLTNNYYEYEQGQKEVIVKG